MNSVILIGRLTKDPELRFTKGEAKAVGNFTLAVDRGFKKDEADFFRVTVWGKVAENCANYLARGSQVAIQGRLQNNNYEDSEGNKRFSTEVVASNVQFLDTRKSKGDNDSSEGFTEMEENPADIPF